MINLSALGRLLRPRVRRVALVSCLVVPALAITQAQEPPDRQLQTVPQDPAGSPDDIPAHLAVVDGAATLERDGHVEAALENVPLLAGDRIRTEAGRVEILFGDGSALDIDQRSGVDLLSDSLLRLLGGQIRLSIARAATPIEYRVDAAGASALIRAAGTYRLSVSDPQAADPEVDLTVLSGSAELSNGLGRTLVRAGTHAVVTPAMAPSVPYSANAASRDAFDRWAEDLRNGRLGAESSRYLPTEVQTYGGVLDQSGSWGYESTYGNVWYPRVAADWRPYYDGQWSYISAYGWTWVGYDRWTWPTHHYGRWGQTSGRWFWIPGRQWGPAWVSWAVSPSYVSWCPLGFDGRAVVSLGFSTSRYDAWTIVPSHAFGPRIAVRRNVVAGPRLGSSNWSQFVARDSGPRPNIIASNRGAPLRSPGGPRGDRAVPRLSNVGPQSAPRSAPVRDNVGTRGGPSRDTSAPGAVRNNDGRSLPGLVSPARPADRGDRDVRTPQGGSRSIPPAQAIQPEASRAVPRSSQIGPPQSSDGNGRTDRSPQLRTQPRDSPSPRNDGVGPAYRYPAGPVPSAPAPDRGRSYERPPASAPDRSAPARTAPRNSYSPPPDARQDSRPAGRVAPRGGDAPSAPPPSAQPNRGQNSRGGSSSAPAPSTQSGRPSNGGGRTAPANAPSRGQAVKRGGGR